MNELRKQDCVRCGIKYWQWQPHPVAAGIVVKGSDYKRRIKTSRDPIFEGYQYPCGGIDNLREERGGSSQTESKKQRMTETETDENLLRFH